MRNCPHVPLLEANTFIVSPLCVCWLPAHSQRLGKLNKDPTRKDPTSWLAQPGLHTHDPLLLVHRGNDDVVKEKNIK